MASITLRAEKPVQLSHSQWGNLNLLFLSHSGILSKYSIPLSDLFQNRLLLFLQQFKHFFSTFYHQNHVSPFISWYISHVPSGNE